MSDHNRLTIKITFPINEPEKFKIESDIKQEHWGEIISEFIRSQMGTGKDNTPAEERDVYNITIQIDLSDDTFYCKHDCGNKGLREGILMDILGRLSDAEASIS